MKDHIIGKLKHMNITKTIIDYVEIKNELGKIRAEISIFLKKENYELASWLRDQEATVLSRITPLETDLKNHQARLSRFDLDFLFEYRFLDKLIKAEPHELESAMMLDSGFESGVIMGGRLIKQDRHFEINIKHWPSWRKYLDIRKKRIEEKLSNPSLHKDELDLINESIGRDPMQILLEKRQQ